MNRERRQTGNIDDTPFVLTDYVEIVRRRWIYFLVFFPASIAIAIYLAYSLPPLYRSSGTILLEASSIPEDMVRTTVSTYADEHIELVQRAVMATSNLEGLLEEVDPYPAWTDATATEKARAIREDTQIERVNPITLEPQAGSTAFSIHYLNPDPNMAQRTAEALVQMFLAQNRDARTARATETYNFLLQQSSEVLERVRDLERRLAEFRAKYGNALPEARARNQEILDRARQGLALTELKMLTAKERRSMLTLQLDQLSPYNSPTGINPQTELARLRSELSVALQRYTEDHPEVKRLRRSIEAMAAETANNIQSNDGLAPENPQYITVANQLLTVEQEIAALQTNIDRYQNDIVEYERQIALAPDVEPEYRELLRSYEAAQGQYRDIEADLNSASLAQTLESEQQGVRFSVIFQPYEPSGPYSPNRMAIILLGFVLGGALSVGIAAAAESSDPTVRNMRDLYDVTHLKPIGSIPVMLSKADRRKHGLYWAAGTATFCAVAAFLGFTIVGAA